MLVSFVCRKITTINEWLNSDCMPQDSQLTESLNDTGIFLEFAVEKALTDIEAAIVESQVAYTLEAPGYEAEHGAIDFVVSYVEPNHSNAVFITECKKADPTYKKWIFFERRPDEQVSVLYSRKYPASEQAAFPDIEVIHARPFLGLQFDRCFQIIGTSNGNMSSVKQKDLIYEAAREAIRGTRAVIENKRRLRELAGQWTRDAVCFVPVVVTTADLYVSSINASEINLADGTAGTAQTFEARDVVELSVAVPNNLQIKGQDRTSVFIVKATAMKTFFSNITHGPFSPLS